jgi:hypothetical protein
MEETMEPEVTKKEETGAVAVLLDHPADGPPPIDAELALALLDIVERYEAAVRADDEALQREMAERAGVKPEIMRGRIGPTRDRLDAVARSASIEGSSREVRAWAEDEVVAAGVSDLLNLSPAVRRAQKAAERQRNRPKTDAAADLVMAELCGARDEVRRRWPNLKRSKQQVVDIIKNRLAAQGHDLSRERIARLLAKR